MWCCQRRPLLLLRLLLLAPWFRPGLPACLKVRMKVFRNEYDAVQVRDQNPYNRFPWSARCCEHFLSDRQFPDCRENQNFCDHSFILNLKSQGRTVIKNGWTGYVVKDSKHFKFPMGRFGTWNGVPGHCQRHWHDYNCKNEYTICEPMTRKVGARGVAVTTMPDVELEIGVIDDDTWTRVDEDMKNDNVTWFRAILKPLRFSENSKDGKRTQLCLYSTFNEYIPTSLNFNKERPCEAGQAPFWIIVDVSLRPTLKEINDGLLNDVPNSGPYCQHIEEAYNDKHGCVGPWLGNGDIFDLIRWAKSAAPPPPPPPPRPATLAAALLTGLLARV